MRERRENMGSLDWKMLLEALDPDSIGISAAIDQLPAELACLFEKEGAWCARIAWRGKATCSVDLLVQGDSGSSDSYVAYQPKAMLSLHHGASLTSQEQWAWVLKLPGSAGATLQGSDVAQLGRITPLLVDNPTHAPLVNDASSKPDSRSADVWKQEYERDYELISMERDKAINSHYPLQRRINQLQTEVDLLRGSRSWKLTAPLRHMMHRVQWMRHYSISAAGLTKRFLAEARGRGPLHAIESAWVYTRARLPSTGRRNNNSSVRPNGLPGAAPAKERLVQRVLIVGELGLPQCLKYRVLQKHQLIQSLGTECTVVNWTDLHSTRSLLQTHTVVIFYRVPGWPEQLKTVEIAKSLGVATIWEVDDLIFDRDLYLTNSNIERLDKRTRRGLIVGVSLYRAMMLACDECIASTPALADAMRSAGVQRVHVIRNALDGETLRIARRLATEQRTEDGITRIVYGSGSRSHDADFTAASEALLTILKSRYYVRLVVIGSLNLPDEFDEVSDQIERLPASDYVSYMGRLSKGHICIAPLEASAFNDGKSNIKYLEAAVLGIPAVCSDVREYRETIVDGENGFLAANRHDWERALTALIESADLRMRIGNAARELALERFAPESIARRDVAPFLATHLASVPSELRVLGVNIFFEPRSFGGATIVAEQLSKRLNNMSGVVCAMLTSTTTADVAPYRIVRYESSRCEVFAMALPHEANPAMDFDNPFPLGDFEHILRAWLPSVVHLHAIQGFGVQLAEACERYGIPYAVTLHDAWWLCARQFMFTGEGKYCGQKRIDIDVCATCVKNASILPYRETRMRQVLSGAALLIAPSAFSRELYIANGFDPRKIVINKNGIRKPETRPERTLPSTRPLRFGFVGGEGVMKGGDLIKKAFRDLPHNDYELLVVDNALNLGRQSIFAEQWKLPGKTKIVPAYTQETIDEFFGEIDVLLCPSQCKESFGLAAREALIRDVWLISTDAGGVVEDIVDRENGVVIPFDDDGTRLAEEIGKLLDNPGLLDGYRNPHSGRISLFETQAEELRSYLEGIAVKDVEHHVRFPSDLDFHESLMRQI